MKRTAPLAVLLAVSLLLEPAGPFLWASMAAQTTSVPSVVVNPGLGGVSAAGPAAQAANSLSAVPSQGLAAPFNAPLATSESATPAPAPKDSDQALSSAQSKLLTAPDAMALPTNNAAANALLSQDRTRPINSAASLSEAAPVLGPGASFNSRLLEFARGIANMGGRQGNPEEAGRAFDGALLAARRAPKPVEAAANPASGPAAGQTAPVSAENTRLAQLHPRTIFLFDVFDKPDAETEQYIQTLVDTGVHVVFLTWRPQKGLGSTEEILLGRIKHGRNNPLIVVSHNGGRIALHSKAEDPLAIIDDVGMFQAKDITTLRAIKDKASATWKVNLKETLDPSGKSPFSYIVSLPKRLHAAEAEKLRAQLLRRYNFALEKAGLPYRMAAHPNDPRAIITHSMPMRMSIKRVLRALQRQFPEFDWVKDSHRIVILVNSKKSPKSTHAFLRELPNAEIQAVKTGEDAREVLRDITGPTRLKKQWVNLNELTQFEWWEAVHRNRPATTESTGGNAGSGLNDEYDQLLAGQVGTIIYELMPWFLKKVSRGQSQQTNLWAVRARIENMWRTPKRYLRFIRKQTKDAMSAAEWKSRGPGYLKSALAWFDNYFNREFRDFSPAMADIMHNLDSTSVDGSILLPFQSPSTGEFFKLYLRNPWVTKTPTPTGLALTAHVPRSVWAKPGMASRDLQGIYPKLRAMALLLGHCRKGPDGRWYHGSPINKYEVVTELRVQVDYLNGARDVTFKPEEFFDLIKDNGAGPRPYEEFLAQEQNHPSSAAGAIDREQTPFVMVPQGIVTQVTGTILRMRADEEFQEYYKKAQEEASAEKKKSEKLSARSSKTLAKKKIGAKKKKLSKKTKPRRKGR